MMAVDGTLAHLGHLQATIALNECNAGARELRAESRVDGLPSCTRDGFCRAFCFAGVRRSF